MSLVLAPLLGLVTGLSFQGPGVLAQFERVQGGAEAQAENSDSRVLPRFALFVPQGRSPSLFLEPGPFRMRLRATLHLDLRDRYRFALVGRGTATLRVRGKVLLQGSLPQPPAAPLLSKPLRLRKGDNPIELEFRSPAQGPAQLRLLWEGSDFPLEPLPSHLLRAPSPAKRDTHSRELLAALVRSSCLACHPDGRLPPGRLPGLLALTGPDLRGAGSRLQRTWFLDWVRDPKALRPGARMPRLLRGEDSLSQALDLAAFLGLEDEAPRPAPSALVREGSKLFERFRCASCHGGIPRGKPAVGPSSRRIPLDRVGRKYRSAALAAFLLHPDRHAPRSAMPRFPIDPPQATALAAFLRSRTPILGSRPPARPGDPTRGKALFSRLGCQACHQAKGVGGEAPKGRPFLDLPEARPCPRTGEPKPPLQRLPQGLPADEEWRSLSASLHCASCHEGSVSPSLPRLDAVGEKLRPSALRALFEGVSSPARPWLQARMPAFAPFARALAEGLAAEAGLPGHEAPLPPPPPALLPLGKKLVSNQGGFGCVLCHAVGKQKALQVFEVEGIDFALVAARLRRSYYERWMWNPQRIDPSSKMPRFASPQGTTAFTEILEGDAKKQFAAIWAYLRSLERH